jgi:hypothetical protein
MPVWGLMLLAFGGFWLCVWRRRWRLLGLAPIVAGYLTLLLPRPPDVLIDGESHLMAVRGADGSYLVSDRQGTRFAEDTWARRGAVGRGPHGRRPAPAPMARSPAIARAASTRRVTTPWRWSGVPRPSRKTAPVPISW